MHSDRGEDVVVTLGNLDGTAIVLDRADCADGDELANAGVGGTLDDRLDIVAELCVGEMAMRIDNGCH